MLSTLPTIVAAAFASFAAGCEDHDWTSPMLGGYFDHALMSRHDYEKRMQPGAQTTLPQAVMDVHWGQSDEEAIYHRTKL